MNRGQSLNNHGRERPQQGKLEYCRILSALKTKRVLMGAGEEPSSGSALQDPGERVFEAIGTARIRAPRWDDFGVFK